MIINLRGTNGSGKSTVVRKFIDGRYPVREVHGIAGPRYPEAYEVNLGKVTRKMLYVLGPYQTPTGGLDALGVTQGATIGLLEKYSRKGHVLLEGVILSTLYGSVGAWFAAHKDEVMVAYLSTPLDECFRSLGERGGNKGTAHVAEKFKSIARTEDKMIEAGIRTDTVTRDNAFDVILGWLKQ